MFHFNPIHLAYGVMGVGMVLCMLVAAKQQRALRNFSNDFAMFFAQLSNHIFLLPPEANMSFRFTDKEKVSLLPMKDQPHEIRQIMIRANDEKSVHYFSQLTKAYNEIEHLSGFNKTKIRQFRDPLYEILIATHTFLSGCENTDTIDTVEKKKQFESFFNDQLLYRMILLKRISGSFSARFQDLNHEYLAEMAEEEQKDRSKNVAHHKRR